MSGKQKALLIVIGVALVVLFIVAVGMGSGKGDGDPNQSNGLVDWLAKVGGKTAAVEPATVTASCPAVDGQPNTFRFTGSCTLTVADPGKLKILILRSTKAFGVEAPGPGDSDFTASDDVEPSPGTGAVAKIAVDKQTDVQVSCPGLNTQCAVTVATE